MIRCIFHSNDLTDTVFKGRKNSSWELNMILTNWPQKLTESPPDGGEGGYPFSKYALPLGKIDRYLY